MGGASLRAHAVLDGVEVHDTGQEGALVALDDPNVLLADVVEVLDRGGLRRGPSAV